MLETIRNIIIVDPLTIITTAGYFGIAGVIFAESGILLGIFLPGDSLLFAAGLIASQGAFNLLYLMPIVVIAAFVGDSLGYWIGRRTGEVVLHRYPRIVKPKYIRRTEEFYEKWGARAIILGRFVPIVRTIVPVLAGIAHMRYERFVRFNAIGALLWGPIVLTLGYVLGQSIPNATHYLLPISFGVIIVSFIPIIVRLIVARMRKTPPTDQAQES